MVKSTLQSIRTAQKICLWLAAVLLLPACAPITSFPNPSSSQTRPSSSGSPSSSPAGGLPSPSSSSSGLPRPSSTPGGLPSVPGASPGQPGAQPPGGASSPGGSTVELPSGQSDSSGAGDDWLNPGGLPNGQGQDDGWQTSNAPTETSSPGNANEPGGSGGGSQRQKSEAVGELDAVLRDIDGSILAEREVLARSGPTKPQANSAESGGSSENADSTAQAGNSARKAQVPTPPNAGGQGSKTAADLPDAKDDDIIARQLREAAMQEQDPQLKEKLWEEYRRYKRS